jgi:hypothetical protein
MQTMEDEHRGPLLIDELLRNHYQMGIFSSAPLYSPPLNRSVFQAIPNLPIEKQNGISVAERDKMVTAQFNDFIEKIDKDKPFFSFLFYDAAHSYCGSEESKGPFQPTVARCNRMTFNYDRDHDLYFNRYKNALFSIDREVKRAIEILESHHFLENTVILIVGDHGEEFDDSKKGYLGHASSYNRYQVQTPLVLYWPNEENQVFTHTTSHFDVVPTLMGRFFHCHNRTSDYSVGTELLNKALRPYFIVSSYVDLGIIEPGRITTIFPAGNYHVELLDGKTIPQVEVNTIILHQVLYDLKRFYQEVG